MITLKHNVGCLMRTCISANGARNEWCGEIQWRGRSVRSGVWVCDYRAARLEAHARFVFLQRSAPTLVWMLMDLAPRDEAIDLETLERQVAVRTHSPYPIPPASAPLPVEGAAAEVILGPRRCP